MSSGHVAMGLLFYPRGGSAQVIKYLIPALAGAGWSAEVLCGSLGPPGERTHAETFFEEIAVIPASYDEALAAFEAGGDPIADVGVPLHPSFEDRAGAPDRVFGAVAPELGDRIVEAWRPFFAAALRHRRPDVFHLHHLTPLQEVAERLAPEVPRITHLHGTELKMIDRIDRIVAGDLPGDLRPEMWAHGPHWAERLRAAARGSDRFVVISPHDRHEAARLLEIDPELVEWIPNGVDTDLFDRSDPAPDVRMARWREWLVDQPQGWDESGVAGSIRYSGEDLAPFADPNATVLLFVGRFLDFKRVPMLIRAYAAARERFEAPAPLVIWGGFPGEWEGEHPQAVARAVGEAGIFLIGWRGHEDLVDGLGCSDVMVAPSFNEPFGQVFLEAMACAVPVIATRSGGPLSFVNTEDGTPNGWLVEPDDEPALTEALVAAVNDRADRVQRAENAYRQIREHFSWAGLAPQFTALYDAARERHGGQ